MNAHGGHILGIVKKGPRLCRTIAEVVATWNVVKIPIQIAVSGPREEIANSNQRISESTASARVGTAIFVRIDF